MKLYFKIIVLISIIISLSSFIKDRNVLRIKACKNNVLLLQKSKIRLEDLTDTLKIIIANYSDNYNYPEMREKFLPCFGVVKTSNVIISIGCDRETVYGFYLKVQNEIERAFNELRQEKAIEKFGKNYFSLPKEKRYCIDEIFPKIISEAEPEWWYFERGYYFDDWGGLKKVYW